MQEADLTAITTNTSPRRVFFSLLKPEVSWTRQSTVSIVFSRALTEKVPSSLNEGQRLTRIILNDDVVFDYFIKMKDYIVKKTRSLRAE